MTYPISAVAIRLVGSYFFKFLVFTCQMNFAEEGRKLMTVISTVFNNRFGLAKPLAFLQGSQAVELPSTLVNVIVYCLEVRFDAKERVGTRVVWKR